MATSMGSEEEQKLQSVCLGCGILGSYKIFNDKQEINYPRPKQTKRKKKWKKIISREESEESGDGILYNLGNECIVNNPDEAIAILMKREFPQILKSKDCPHDVFFVPHSFNYGKMAMKVIFSTETREELDIEKQKLLQKHDNYMTGMQMEEKVFYKIRATMKGLNVKNTFVINSWRNNKVNDQCNDEYGNITTVIKQREFDFLIVSDELKAVIHIEVKKSFCKEAFEKGLQQLQSGYDLFLEKIPIDEKFGWNYIKVLHFGSVSEMEENTFCHECSKFVLGSHTDYDTWWKWVEESFKTTQNNFSQSDLSYLNISKYLLYQMFHQGDALSLTDQLVQDNKMIEAASTMKKVFFWSNIQYSLLHSAPEILKLAMTSAFGTGKTVLLKEKARSLLENSEKVVVLVFNDAGASPDSLLLRSYQKSFKDFDNLVFIKAIFNSGVNTYDQILEIFNNNPDAHFFFDEVVVGQFGLSPQQLKQLSEKLQPGTFFWLACQSENPPDNSSLKGFFVPSMSHLLRYSSNAIRVTKLMKESFCETIFPPQHVNADAYLNKGSRSIFLALKKDAHMACAIDQLVFLLQRERGKTLIKIDFEKETIIPELLKSSIRDNLIFPDASSIEIDNFLDDSNNDKIMVVSSRDNSFIRGIDVPIVVHFTSGIEGSNIEGIYSRGKLKLIVVCNEECATKVVPFNADCDFAKTIQVFGNLMPEGFKDAISRENIEDLRQQYIRHPRRPLSVDVRNKGSQTGLMLSCDQGGLKTVNFFLDSGANLDCVDAKGWAAIHYASSNGHLVILERIITEMNLKNIPVDVTTNQEEMAIHIAAAEGKLDVINFLVDQKHFDVNIETKSGHTPLHFAVENNRKEAVTVLLHLGANPDQCSNNVLSPLGVAASNGLRDIVTELHHSGANINLSSGTLQETPLHLASKNGHLGVVELFVNNGLGLINAKQVQGFSPIHLASENGHLEVVKVLAINGKADLNTRTNKSLTPLHSASLHGHLNIVDFLVTEGKVGVDVKNPDGWTPLHAASGNGHLKVVEFLVSIGKADVNVKKKDGSTPLHSASGYGHLNIVRFLVLDAKAKCTVQKDDGWTPLHAASRQGHLSIVNFLVKEGKENANVKNQDGFTPLHVASGNGHLEIVEFLIKEGKADINVRKKDGWTPLHSACKHGQLDVVKYLIVEGKANIGFKKDDGWTPLHAAAAGGNLDVVKFLVFTGQADVNVTNKDGLTPLHVAAGNGHLDIVRFLVIDSKAKCSVRKDDGWTPLHSATRHGHLSIVKFLIVEGTVDVNVKNKVGFTPLHAASGNGHLEIVKFLVHNGKADINIKKVDGWTPLHSACKHGHLEVVKYLVVDGKAKVDVLKDDGGTPLHAAAAGGNLDVVKFLVSKGNADVNAKQKNGSTPLHASACNGHLDIVKFLMAESKAKTSLETALSLLHLASSKKHKNVEDFLRKAFANILTKKKAI